MTTGAIAIVCAIALIATAIGLSAYVGQSAFIKKEKETELDRLMEKTLNGAYKKIEDYDEKSEEFLECIPAKFKDRYKKLVARYREVLEIKFLAEKHYYTITRKLNSSIIKNDYGVVVKDNSEFVYGEFIESMGFKFTEELKQAVIDALASFGSNDPETGFDPNTYPEDGPEFEHWVAENIIKFGWKAQVTGRSGDQGVDVIATKEGVRLGIQCKQYTSGKIGNSAVQEIVGAKAMFGLTHLAVIATSQYTPGAKKLAEANSVALLSHYDIPRLDQIFITELHN